VVFLTLVFGLDGRKKFRVSLFNQNLTVVHGSPQRQWAWGSIEETRAAQANG
jgi:hypothetical protein